MEPDKEFQAEVMNQVIIRLGEMEKQHAQVPDYTIQFDMIKEQLTEFVERYAKDNQELIAAIGKLNIAYPAGQISKVLSEVRLILIEVRNRLSVTVTHQLSPKTKLAVVLSVIKYLVTVIAIGLCAHFWTRNSELDAYEIKYRMLKQVIPKPVNWVDSIYMMNPSQAETTTKELEGNPNAVPVKSKHKKSKRK